MRQISKARARRIERAKTLRQIETHLERTAWGKGTTTHRTGVPGARPAQIRAGAKKLYDVIAAQVRREQRVKASE